MKLITKLPPIGQWAVSENEHVYDVIRRQDEGYSIYVPDRDVCDLLGIRWNEDAGPNEQGAGIRRFDPETPVNEVMDFIGLLNTWYASEEE